jgi:S1-C subfamily serine protease
VLKFVKYLIFIIILSFPTAAIADKTQTSNQVSDIIDETVALVDTDKDVFCAGVWVSNDTILTANHCIEYNVKWLKHLQIRNDDIIKSIKPMGLHMDYAVASEMEADKIVRTYIGTVIALDKDHDLALIRVDFQSAPKHKIAHISTHKLLVGSDVQIVGHQIGLNWSYTNGIIAGIRSFVAGTKELGINGPFIQISGPIWHGNSGGGVFNPDGELIGIVSFISANAPNIGFAIATDSVEQFISKN